MVDWVKALSVALAFLMAGCQSLPRSGPSAAATQGGATMQYVSRAADADYRYVIIELSRPVAQMMAADPAPTATPGGLAPFGNGGGSSLLHVGDTVQVTLYEAESGGLFVPSDAGGRTGNSLALPPQQVSPQGTITVPYAGQVRASGRSIPTVEADITKRLADRAIEPQTIISLVNSPSSQVSVLGDVNSPARFAVDPSGERVLDAIARAGGVRNGDSAAAVTLQRAGQSRTAHFADVVTDPRQNVVLRPGDVVYVRRDHRDFIALGASGTNGSFPFDGSNLSLADAIGKAGGINDSRADPGYVYLYREVPRDVLARAGVDLSGHPEAMVPVIFHANLRDPAQLFAASQFPMRDHDILYVSNAVAYDFSKFVTLIGDTANAASRSVYTVNGVGQN